MLLKNSILKQNGKIVRSDKEMKSYKIINLTNSTLSAVKQDDKIERDLRRLIEAKISKSSKEN